MPYGVNPKTGRPGPSPKPFVSGDKVQARHAVNQAVKRGDLRNPNELSCVDCGHIGDDKRHEYDHYLGYDAKDFLHVQPVCTKCHSARDNSKANQTVCQRGHRFDSVNTGLTKQGRRFCKACRRMRDRNRVRPDGYWKAVNAKRNSKGGSDG